MSLAPVLRLLALIVFAVPALAQSPGTVSILNRLGQHVDGNSYARKDAAYLSAGPGPSCFAAGLADGDYCFQITDPAGTVLLTPEPIAERSVRVTAGRMSAYLGTTRPSANNGPCGALNLRLAPFVTTPYPSGEYKLWLTRVQDYDAGGSHLFGFDPARSKSDNFRVSAVGPQSILRGHKFYDHNADATWNPGVDPLELPVGGWRVEIRRNGVLDGVTYTDQDGTYLFIRDRDNTPYEVREISPNGFVNEGTPGATWVSVTRRKGVYTASTEYVAALDFGNVRYELSVAAGRPVDFWADDDDDDDHGDDHDDDEDDDHCDGEHGGRALLQAADPLWRQALTTRDGAPVNLRRPISSDVPHISIYFPPPLPEEFHDAYESWEHFANRHSHDHAGFLLSREVAATLLNNTAGFMQGSILVDRFQNGVLVSLDDMLRGAIGLLSETGAGLTGPNDPYQDLRMRMQMCTNEFGSINNTGDPSAPQVVYTRSSEAGMIFAPY